MRGRAGASSKLLLFVHLLVLASQSLVTRADDDGDWYDNRDGGHADVSLRDHPGVQGMSSGYGPQVGLIDGRVVVGNASLAITGGQAWGSMVRVSLMREATAPVTYQQYTRNNAYWYPEHRDHDGKDHYHAMTPTVSSSQGSSRSELDEVHKWFYTLAAFRPEAKARLREAGLLMPTIQMIFRRTRVASDAEYLSGKAHPSAFDDADNRAAMELMAGEIRTTDIPPMVQLRVLEDSYDGLAGRDFFESRGVEDYFDTPVSIARIFRGRQFTKRLVVTAEDSFDLNGLPLTYRWRLLRGSPSGVRIRPRSADGSEVEILIDYHPETTIENSTRLTNLVAVGAFVHNGHYYSAPAFVTSFTLNNESRSYDPATRRLLRIAYNSSYVHPRLSTAKGWDSDTFVYDEAGTLKGWLRRTGTATVQFSSEGRLVVRGDLETGVLETARVRYDVDPETGLLDWTVVPDDEPPPPALPCSFALGEVETTNCGVFAVEVFLTASCIVSGFSFGLAHDPRVLRPLAALPSGVTVELRGGEGPEYWEAILDPATEGCDGAAAGIAVTMAASLDGAGDEFLPPGFQRNIATILYEPVSGVGVDTETTLEFTTCTGVGDRSPGCSGDCGPSLWIGQSLSVRIEGSCFLRGDCNADARFDISDPISTLLYLFCAHCPTRPLLCLDACDGNDDGDVDISDAVIGLIYLFTAAPSLPEPFHECGRDVTRSALDCESYPECG